MQPIQKYKLVYLTLAAGTTAGAQVRFPDVPELRGKEVVGLEVYPSSMLTNTPDLQASITAADSAKVTLTLKDFSTERIQDIPLATLVPTNTAGIWKQLKPFSVNWQSSFTRCTAAPATLPCTVPVGVMYLD